jgi:hypothetical protein
VTTSVTGVKKAPASTEEGETGSVPERRRVLAERARRAEARARAR